MFLSIWINPPLCAHIDGSRGCVVATLLPSGHWNYELFHLLAEAGSAQFITTLPSYS